MAAVMTGLFDIIKENSWCWTFDLLFKLEKNK